MKLTQDLLIRLQAGERPTAPELATLLNAQGKACDLIYQAANTLCQRVMGYVVHLRGIIEFSNVCKNNCWYCGIRCENKQIERYRMSQDQILDIAKQPNKTFGKEKQHYKHKKCINETLPI